MTNDFLRFVQLKCVFFTRVTGTGKIGTMLCDRISRETPPENPTMETESKWAKTFYEMVWFVRRFSEGRARTPKTYVARENVSHSENVENVRQSMRRTIAVGTVSGLRVRSKALIVFSRTKRNGAGWGSFERDRPGDAGNRSRQTEATRRSTFLTGKDVFGSVAPWPSTTVCTGLESRLAGRPFRLRAAAFRRRDGDSGVVVVRPKRKHDHRDRSYSRWETARVPSRFERAFNGRGVSHRYTATGTGANQNGNWICFEIKPEQDANPDAGHRAPCRDAWRFVENALFTRAFVGRHRTTLAATRVTPGRLEQRG